MSEQFIGEIRMFAGNFPPSGWAFCNGATLAISEYETLYALIGTTYGGDGVQTFQLPDLRGRSAVHMGTNASGQYYPLGQVAGVEAVTLVAPQMPAHTHQATYTSNATSTSPAQARWATQATGAFSDAATPASLSAPAVAPTGGSQPHDNMPPFVAVSYIIALWGIFPSQA